MTRDRDRIRLFVGVRVSLDTVAQLSAVAKELRRAVSEVGAKIKWVAPASYHVTVKFLGWTRPDAIEAIRDVLTRELEGMAGFELTTRGLGAFPSPTKARVLWAGVEPPDQLALLVEKIESGLEEIGYPREKRPFHGHVTLGRAREVANLESVLLPYAEQNFSETSVDSVLLFESVMKPQGSEYSVVAEWPLEARSNGSKRQTEKLKPTTSTHQREAGDSGEDGNGFEQGNHE